MLGVSAATFRACEREELIYGDWRKRGGDQIRAEYQAALENAGT